MRVHADWIPPHFLVAQRLSRRFDKKRALSLCAIIGGVFAFSPQMLYFGGFLGQLDDTIKFILIFSVNGISQVFFIAYMILLDSMLSDTIDEHQLNTGRREEGLFFAARSFATKASYGLGSFVAGIGLDVIRFPQSATPESVPQEAVFNLAILSGPVMLVLFVATVMISNRYPMTEGRHREITAKIAASEAGAQAGAASWVGMRLTWVTRREWVFEPAFAPISRRVFPPQHLTGN